MPCRGVWQFGLGPPMCSSSGRNSVCKRGAARFITGYFNYETGSMTGILGQLKWESLNKRMKDNGLMLLYNIKALKGNTSIPTDDLIPKTRRGRNQHFMAFQTPIASTMFINVASSTIRDWNALPNSLISSAENAEDCVDKFSSLIRARV